MKKIPYCLKIVIIMLLSFHAFRGLSQFDIKIVYGKIYNQSRGKQYPAAYKRIVIMQNTRQNLELAQDIYNSFDDSTIKTIRGAKSVLTSKDGKYVLKNIAKGKYIIRVTGMGGMVIKFELTSDNYTQKKIPDMPADYYYKREEYMQKSN